MIYSHVWRAANRAPRAFAPTPLGRAEQGPASHNLLQHRQLGPSINSRQQQHLAACAQLTRGLPALLPPFSQGPLALHCHEEIMEVSRRGGSVPRRTE